MLLRHTRFPNIQINTPVGAPLKFQDFLCEVSDDLADLIGQDFFDKLMLNGSIELAEGKYPIARMAPTKPAQSVQAPLPTKTSTKGRKGKKRK